jgi:hypothetical protein
MNENRNPGVAGQVGWDAPARAQLGESVNDPKAAIDETRRRKRTMSKYAREVTEKDFDQIVSCRGVQVECG